MTTAINFINLIDKLPNCPIAFEIRHEPCVPFVVLTQREHLIGTRHYDCDGTTAEFLEWAKSRVGQIELGKICEQHQEFFINVVDGGMIEITTERPEGEAQ
jgi:hypothetical protein